MSEAKHTPAPWRVKPPTTSSHSPCILAENGDHLATVWTKQTTGNEDQPKILPSALNAYVMAAGPDLLFELKRAERLATNIPVFAEYLPSIRAAIAKATGDA